MGRIYLIRHGATVWSYGDQRYCGSTDLELSEQGLREAERIADRLANESLATVYATPLVRSRQTAEAVAKRHHVQVEVVTDLREAAYGDWEGLNYAEVAARYPDLDDERMRNPAELAPPSGENLNELIGRAVPALMMIAKHHIEEQIAVVGHNTVNRVLLCHFLEVPVAHYKRIVQSPAAINVLEFAGDSMQVITINDTCHLGSVAFLEF